MAPSSKAIDKRNLQYQKYFSVYKNLSVAKGKFANFLDLQAACNAAWRTVGDGGADAAIAALQDELDVLKARRKARLFGTLRPSSASAAALSSQEAAPVPVSFSRASSTGGLPSTSSSSTTVPRTDSADDVPAATETEDDVQQNIGPRQQQTERKAAASKKSRDKKRQVIDETVTERAASPLPGRPRIEIEQPGLQQTILRIVDGLAGADGRRRTERLEVCATVDDLHKKVLDAGFVLSKTALYYRLLPRRQGTTEARRHLNTVPVKLIRPTNSQHRYHPDGHFANATVKYLKDLAVVLGAGVCFVLSQDDKARVPLGLTAANKQSALVMHMEYRVSLPDHDWVIAERHKSIPSVYAACAVTADKVKVHGGPTYIAVRSGKHDRSTAQSHAIDLQRLLELEEFTEFTKTETGDVKPIVICSVDGGPDENPRYPKTLAAWVEHFKALDLDAVFVATHAPGQSAFNAVERRMAPLSHALAGVILPHDTYGSHLDNRGRTTDVDLEKRNFGKAGETLAELWSQKVIDGCPVIAEYVKPTDGDDSYSHPTEAWAAAHVRQSQYLLQVVRCQDRLCCAAWRSNYVEVLPGRFLPPPTRFIRTASGVEVAPVEGDVGNYGSIQQRVMLDVVVQNSSRWRIDQMPFDAFCPSVRDALPARTCPSCAAYFPSATAVQRHRRAKICSERIELFEDSEDDGGDGEDDDDDETALPPLDDAQEEIVMPVRNVFDDYAVSWEYDD